MTATDLDPFGTARLRAAVLASWSDSPTRFREDANAEEDLLLDGYGTAWLVELAQNAADAAVRQGRRGRLLIRIADGAGNGSAGSAGGAQLAGSAGVELRVANTGDPLDAAGVTALASLRASAKRPAGQPDSGGPANGPANGQSIGQFGVGFAAVLPLSGEPRIVSARGGVVFSETRTAEAVSALDGPARELARRAGQLPVLRLVWPTEPDEPPPPDGYDTEVRLPLRPDLDPDALLSAAADSAADLLLAMPELREITVDTRVTRRRARADGVVAVGEQRWQVVRHAGVLAAELLAGLGVEQRGRSAWSLTWAVPVDAFGTPHPADSDVLHAPTPTEERLTLPARLVATLPLEPSRRRIRPGPVVDALLDAAGPAYLELVLALAPGDRAVLVPTAGFPASELDALLRERVLAALRDAPWLPAADGSELAPRRAVVLDLPGDELPGLLADVVPGLLAADCAPAAALTALGVPRLGAAQLVDRLAGLDRPPGWWRSLYAGINRAVEQGHVRAEELAALPVPLVDGRTVTGPASCALRASEFAVPGHGFTLPGLRIVHPEAEHPLLLRLGATRLGPAELLDAPAVAAAVEQSVENAEVGLDVAPLAAMVLALVERAGPIEPGTRPWLAALALPDVDSEPRRADELVLPDAAIRPLLAADTPLGVLAAEIAESTPRDVLTSVGVLDGFAVLVDEHPLGPDHDLADERQWWTAASAARNGEPPTRLAAVRDLDLVAERAWPDALRVLADDPACRAAVLDGAFSYTAWWLSRHAWLDGHPLRHWRLPAATRLAGLYDPVDLPDVDDELLAAIGVRADATVADAADAADLLGRLIDSGRKLGTATTCTGYRELVAAVRAGRIDPEEIDPPPWVRTLSGEVVDAEHAAVLDEPWLAAALRDTLSLVVGGDPVTLADLLYLPLASDIVRGTIRSTGQPRSWADLFEVTAACAAVGADVPAGELWLHETLEIELVEPTKGTYNVPVWRDQADVWHASDPVRALLARLATL